MSGGISLTSEIPFPVPTESSHSTFLLAHPSAASAPPPPPPQGPVGLGGDDRPPWSPLVRVDFFSRQLMAEWCSSWWSITCLLRVDLGYIFLTFVAYFISCSKSVLPKISWWSSSAAPAFSHDHMMQVQGQALDLFSLPGLPCWFGAIDEHRMCINIE